MDNNIKKMYCFDCAILAGLSVLLVFIISYVLYSLGHLQNEPTVRAAIMASGLLAIIFALIGMMTVIYHLRQNGEELYSDYAEIQKIYPQIEAVESETV